jgi:hypothetical protein
MPPPLWLKPAACGVLIGLLLGLPIGWLAPPRDGGRPPATASFLDDMTATNARMAADLDVEQKGLDDAGRAAAYREWRKRYDEAARAVYARHDREPPDHLKVK